MTRTGDEIEDTGLLSPVRAGTPVEGAVSDTAWLRAMLDAESALARAQAHLGTLPAHAADTITRTAQECELDLKGLSVTARESANPVVAMVRMFGEAVAERDPDAAQYVHRGSTSQDVFDTGAMLVSRRALRLMLGDLRTASEALEQLSRAHRDTPMAGRTLALQAVPTTFGLKAAGWRALVMDALERLERLLGDGLPVSLGGAAGTLAGYIEYGALDGDLDGSDPGTYTDQLVEAFARETGLAVQRLPWHSLRTPIADISSVLAFVAGALGKIAVDVLTLSRTEIGEVAEPGPPGRGASSAMPHKRNPVLATMIRSAAVQVPALTNGLAHCLSSEDERSGGLWHAEWSMLREALRLTGGATHTLVELSAGLEARPERMGHNLTLASSTMNSERLAAVLTPLLGRPRARELSTQCVREAVSQERPMAEVLGEFLEAEPATAGAFSPSELTRLCDPAEYTGAAAELVDRSLDRPAPR